MKKYKLAAFLMIIHGGCMELGGVFCFIPALILGTDKFDISQYFSFQLPYYQDNPLLAALFGGILSGAGLAIIYLSGSSTGGTDFLIMSVRKRIPHMSIGTITLAIDGAVIVAGGFVFGNINAVLYGVLMTVASTLVIDKLMYGSGARKMLLVISDESEKIAQRISNEVGRGVTLFKATGAYTGKERIVVMCFCSKREIIHMRSIVYSIDENAMVTFSTVDEAYGLGFKPFAEDQ